MGRCISKIPKQGMRVFLCLVAFFGLVSASVADEVLVTLGGGSQPRLKQYNEQIGMDYSFYETSISKRSSISVGVSYAQLRTDVGIKRRIEVFSVYPQLTIRPVTESMHGLYFFVRALGPSYITETRFGKRKLGERFIFLVQAGFGYEKKLENDKAIVFQGSWKHFSNANLFDDNDGMDVPFLLSLGYKF